MICKPFGYEALCSHRTIRVLAESVADLGIPTLRFDYAGTGDSEDLQPRADQIQAWVADIVAAVGELRRRLGVESVCLLGFRLGAMLATLAAAKCGHGGALILGAPVVSGRRYLRDLRTTHLASLMGLGERSSDAGLGADGSLEVSGYELSAASIAALSQIDLANITSLSVSRVLIIDRDDLPAARNWHQELSRRGVCADYLALPGFVQMLMTAPQSAVVPQAIVAAACSWLLAAELKPAGPAREAHAKPRASALEVASPTLRLPGASPGPEAMVVERPVTFGADPPLFGIVSEPRAQELRRRAVILLNTGADWHTGVGRLYVSLARSWARRGYHVLRMDLEGLGDSGTRKDRASDEVFPPGAIEGIGAAIEMLGTRYGIRDVTLAGLCSGAYHALRAAVAGLPVRRILMVNPQNFFWKQGTKLEELQLADIVRNPAIHRERLFSAGAWRRLLAGEINVWRIMRVYLHRPLLTLRRILRDLTRSLHIRLPSDLGWELEHIDSRALRIVFVFARGEPGIDLLALQAGSSIRRLGERCRVHIVDGADHTFSNGWSRAALEAILSAELFVEQTQSVVAPLGAVPLGLSDQSS